MENHICSIKSNLWPKNRWNRCPIAGFSSSIAELLAIQAIQAISSDFWNFRKVKLKPDSKFISKMNPKKITFLAILFDFKLMKQ